MLLRLHTVWAIVLFVLCLHLHGSSAEQNDTSVVIAGDEETPRVPLKASEEDALTRRWLQKEVRRRRLLDDMESLDAWKVSVWNQGQGDVQRTAERSKDGQHSMRFSTVTTGTKPSPDGGVFGATHAVRSFDGEDWSDFNRLSFWVYPQLPGFHAVALSVRLANRGKQLGRDTHHFLLENNRWNQVVWEFPDVDRDQVTELAFVYVINGHEPGATGTAVFDIDHMELEAGSLGEGKVELSLEIEGAGQHTLNLRTFNLDGETNDKRVELLPGQPQTVRWQVSVHNAKQPWIAVLIPDGEVSQRIEIMSHTVTTATTP